MVFSPATIKATPKPMKNHIGRFFSRHPFRLQALGVLKQHRQQALPPTRQQTDNGRGFRDWMGSHKKLPSPRIRSIQETGGHRP